MASSHRTRCRRQQQSSRRHRFKLESLEKRYALDGSQSIPEVTFSPPPESLFTVTIDDTYDLVSSDTEQKLNASADYVMRLLQNNIAWQGVLDAEIQIRPHAENPNQNADGLLPSIISQSWTGTDWSNDTLHEMKTGIDRQPDQADVGCTIYLSESGEIKNYGTPVWFDSFPTRLDYEIVLEPMEPGYFDFIGVFTHEVFHGLGFLRYSHEFTDLTTSDGDFDFFVGPATQAIYGGPLPLAPSDSSTYPEDHYGNTSYPENNVPSGLLYQWGNYEQNRLDIGKIDLAVLEDLGVNVHTTAGLPTFDIIDSQNSTVLARPPSLTGYRQFPAVAPGSGTIRLTWNEPDALGALNGQPGTLVGYQLFASSDNGTTWIESDLLDPTVTEVLVSEGHDTDITLPIYQIAAVTEAGRGFVGPASVQNNSSPFFDRILDWTEPTGQSGSHQLNLTGITAGFGENQPLRITASNNATVHSYISPESTAEIMLFLPVPDHFLPGDVDETYTITVEDGGFDNNLDTASDNGTYSQSFTVTVPNDLYFPDPPYDLYLSHAAVNENEQDATVGYFVSNLTDPTSLLGFSLTAGLGDTDNGLFYIEGDLLKTNTSFNYEAQQTASIRVRVENSGGYHDQVFEITIKNVNEPPDWMFFLDYPVAVEENLPSGSPVSHLLTNDPDDWTPDGRVRGTFTYALVQGAGDENNGSFMIVDDVLQTNEIFDYESKDSYSIRVRTTDSEGLSFEKYFSINISNCVNERPILDPSASPQLNSIIENTFLSNSTGQVGTLVLSLIDSGAPDDVLDFPATVLPGISIGNLPSGYETSGLTWHDGLQKLFAVSDESIISMMNADGTELVNWNVLGDLEALTVADHTSTKIYIGVEHPDSIFEFDVSTGQVTRTFELTNWMTGADSKGLEALAFVPDATHPEGGLFYAGLQEDGRIYQFSLPIATSSSSTAVNFVQSISIEGGSTDLAGLTYESSSGQLLAIFDSIDQLNVIDRDGQLRSRWTVPGAGQEAVFYVDGDLYVGDDTLRSITRYSGFDALIETGGTHNNFNDDDGDLPGIAITGVNLQGGILFYSINNGTSWSNVGAVSADSARVLYADSETRLAFSPALNFNGVIDDVVTFKAWDRTGGYTNGEAGVSTTIGNRSFPTLTGTLATLGMAQSVIPSADGNTVFVADGTSGLLIIDVSDSSSPTLTGTLDTPGSANYVSLSADGNTAFVADDTSGLQIIDVSDLSFPTLAGTFETSGRFFVLTLSADENTVYIADGTSGLQIINVSDPSAPTLTGTFETPGTARGIALSADGNTAFVGDSHGLQIIDVSDPSNPTLTGTFTLDTSGSAYRLVLSADENTAYITTGDSGLQIINVSDPSAPTLTGTYDTFGRAKSVSLSADENIAYIADGTNGLQLIDVSDPSNPITAGRITDSDTLGYFRDVTLSSDGNTAYVAALLNGLHVINLMTNDEFSSATDTVSLTVEPINNPPTLDPIVDRTITEDSLEQSVLLTGISAGDGEYESVQVFATSSNTDLIPHPTVTLAATWPFSTASLSFEPEADASGTATITVTVENVQNAIVTQTFTVTVTPVNDPPTMDELENPVWYGDEFQDKQVTFEVGGITAGGNEYSQPLRVYATSSNPTLVTPPATQWLPSITIVPAPPFSTEVTYTVKAGQSGPSIITLTVEDGGLDNDLSTLGDNTFTSRESDVIVLLVISGEPSITTKVNKAVPGDQVLARDVHDNIFVDGQPVIYNQQQVPQVIFGSSVVSADTSDSENALMLKPLGADAEDQPTHRLLTDETWRINGIFNSLQNASSPVLDLSGREVSVPLNIVAVAGAYEINGVNNPTLIVRRGQAYTFNLNAAGHPFYLQTTGSGYQSADAYSGGFTGNGQTSGEHQWVVPEDAPDEIFYQCEFHPVMFGKIIVVD